MDEWYGYVNKDGEVFVERYLSPNDFAKTKRMPFVKRTVGPFPAIDRMDAMGIADIAAFKAESTEQARRDLNPKSIPEAKAQARREVAAVYEHNLKIEIDDALDEAAELKVEAAALAKEVARLTSLIEDKGPHNVRCGIYSSGHKCNCWKGEALEGGK